MISILIIIAIFTFLYYYFCETYSYWHKKGVNGPKPIVGFGNLKDSALRRKHVGIIYKELYDDFPEEKVIGVYRMTNPSLIIRDLDVIKQILIKDFEVFPERGVEFSKNKLGNNLFHCNFSTWKALRPRLTPMFTSNKLKTHFHYFNDHANRLNEHLKYVTKRQNECEMHEVFQKYTMSSIIAVCFGLNINLFHGGNEIVRKAGYAIFRSTYAGEVDMLLPNILKKLNMSLYNELVNKFCSNLVQSAISQKKCSPFIQNDLIDTLLAMKKESEIGYSDSFADTNNDTFNVSEQVMNSQVFIFFAAGFGNNSLSLSYALYQLAKNPDIQEKAIQEIDVALEKFNGKLTYNTLKDLPYLNKIFMEVMRMNPLTNSIQRSAKEKYLIKGTDVSIDKGTTIIISPYAIHRDEKLYPDPDRFDPERFSLSNAGSQHPCAYIPFGAGPRSCLGRQLAKLQFLTAIVSILSTFRVEPSEKTPMIENYEPMCTLLATKGGVYLKIIPRNVV